MTATAPSTGSTRITRITRQDLEQAFGSLLGETRETATGAVPQAVVAAGALTLTVVAVSYLLGRRRGRRRSAVVEIRRV